jgi:hypothetical protein
MDRNGRPVLADFGLARVAGAASDLTATGIMVGTPLYMAPELAQGAEASTSTDLYALGVLAYQMLCGATPFNAETPVAVLHQHVAQEVPPLSKRISGLPQPVDDVLARALGKQADERFPTGMELARALGASFGCNLPAVTPRPTAATQTAPTSVESSSDALVNGSLAVTPVPSAAPARGENVDGPHRSGTRWSVAFIALFAVLGIMLGARSLLGRTDATPPPPTATETTPRDESSRRPRPMDADAFTKLASRTAAALQSKPADPSLSALAAYADGGLAYSRGDDDAARAAVDRVRSFLGDKRSAQGIPAWIADGRTADTLTDWEMAAIYGDARGVGLTAVDTRLAKAPEDFRARMGRALLLHLANRHEEAIEQALSLHALLPGSKPQSSGQLLRFVADEYVELERWDEAVRAYREVVDLGGPAAAQAGMDGGRIALRKLKDRAVARELFQGACDAGNDLACGRVSGARTRRPRRASR